MSVTTARSVAIAAALAFGAALAPVRADEAAAGTGSAAPVAEPPGLWTGPLQGDTPATLQGAQVIDAAALQALLARRPAPVLVDVGPADRKPESLPPGTLWKPAHHSIPGAVWFPGGGRGDLPPVQAEALLRRIEALAQGDRSRPVVTFCRPRCWGSWNVGKRLVQAGYTAVHWFPAGLNGWQELHHTVTIEADPAWAAAAPAAAAP